MKEDPESTQPPGPGRTQIKLTVTPLGCGSLDTLNISKYRDREAGYRENEVMQAVSGPLPRTGIHVPE
jgi:hypothetical protein